MAQTTCIFCERSSADVKMTREHLWPNWINRLPPTAGFSGPGVRTRIVEDEARREAQSWSIVVPADQQVRCVCEACNGGWMSDIEAAAKPHILAMMDGNAHSLGYDAQLVLVTWTTLKAMVMEFAQPGDGRRYVFTQLQRTELMHSLGPIADVAVVIASAHLPDSRLNAFLAANNLGPILSALQAMPTSPGAPFPTDQTVRVGAWFTIAIGQLVLQAFAGEIANAWLRHFPPETNAQVSAMPTAGEPVEWPPQVVMDRAAFEHFARPFPGAATR